MSIKYFLICLFSMVVLGMNFVVSKLGIQHFPPILFSALRWLAIMPLVCFVSRPQIPFKTMVLISLCWAMLYNVGVNFALFSGVSAGSAVLVIQSSTFISIFLAILFLNEHPKFQQLIGITIGFVGLYLICSSQGFSANVFGFLALLVSAISWSIGTLIVKKAPCEPIALMIWIATLAAIPMLFLSYYCEENLWWCLTSATFFDWSMVVFASWISILLGGVCWVYVLNRSHIATVMPFRLLIPVFGCGFAYTLLGENYPFITVVGGGFVIFGLAVSQLSSEWTQGVMRWLKQT